MSYLNIFASLCVSIGLIFIVAEIGVNHEGDVNTAIDLIKKAAVAGVDAVKFQTYNADTYISEVQPERKNRTKKFELSREEFKLLSVEAKRSGLNFFSTPLHFDDIDFLSKFSSQGDFADMSGFIRYNEYKEEYLSFRFGLKINITKDRNEKNESAHLQNTASNGLRPHKYIYIYIYISNNTN